MTIINTQKQKKILINENSCKVFYFLMKGNWLSSSNYLFYKKIKKRVGFKSSLEWGRLKLKCADKWTYILSSNLTLIFVKSKINQLITNLV